MARDIVVSVILGENGNGLFEFCETESGDFHRICTSDGISREDVIRKLGEELYSWLELMEDERDYWKEAEA